MVGYVFTALFAFVAGALAMGFLYKDVYAAAISRQARYELLPEHWQEQVDEIFATYERRAAVGGGDQAPEVKD